MARQEAHALHPARMLGQGRPHLLQQSEAGESLEQLQRQLLQVGGGGGAVEVGAEQGFCAFEGCGRQAGEACGHDAQQLPDLLLACPAVLLDQGTRCPEHLHDAGRIAQGLHRPMLVAQCTGQQTGVAPGLDTGGQSGIPLLQQVVQIPTRGRDGAQVVEQPGQVGLVRLRIGQFKGQGLAQAGTAQGLPPGLDPVRGMLTLDQQFEGILQDPRLQALQAQSLQGVLHGRQLTVPRALRGRGHDPQDHGRIEAEDPGTVRRQDGLAAQHFQQPHHDRGLGGGRAAQRVEFGFFLHGLVTGWNLSQSASKWHAMCTVGLQARGVGCGHVRGVKKIRQVWPDQGRGRCCTDAVSR